MLSFLESSQQPYEGRRYLDFCLEKQNIEMSSSLFKLTKLSNTFAGIQTQAGGPRSMQLTPTP